MGKAESYLLLGFIPSQQSPETGTTKFPNTKWVTIAGHSHLPFLPITRGGRLRF